MFNLALFSRLSMIPPMIICTWVSHTLFFAEYGKIKVLLLTIKFICFVVFELIEKG